ncbi:helix-turn-helix domain-containing protein [Tistrella mobilis]|uniref:helix-turn-helix domain-containing protein n=1 Tax=Tistrella mobilis TaxID=171437 RepID=UPI0009D9ED85|nr:helix-turn-helix domain-containing protein [Tistrella mobilis]
MASSPPKRPSADVWHPEQIKAAVRMQGMTLAELARLNGLPEYACRHALRHPDLDGELVIAEYLGLSPRQIWPERFRADGSRRNEPKGRRTNAIDRPAVRHCQKRKVA